MTAIERKKYPRLSSRSLLLYEMAKRRAERTAQAAAKSSESKADKTSSQKQSEH